MNRKTMLVLATAGAVAGASALTCASVAGSGPRTTVGSVHAHAAVFTDGAPAGSEATYPVPMATDADFASEVAQRAELLGLPAPSLSETATNRVCAAEASTPSTADEPHAYVCFPDTGSAASYVRGGDVATSSVQTAALRIGYVPRGSGGTRASVSGAYLIGVLEYNNGGSNLVYGAGTCTHGFPNNDYFVDNLNSNMWTAGLYSGIYDAGVGYGSNCNFGVAYQGTSQNPAHMAGRNLSCTQNPWPSDHASVAYQSFTWHNVGAPNYPNSICVS